MAKIERMVTIYEKQGTLRSLKVNRNGLCQCGSGKKQKYCHPQEKVRYFSTKPKEQTEPEAVDLELKAVD